ncbi:DUF2798 domain-containing protein [Agarivorans sp. OAG1]|uniref:DUF2798 domain-containing protein n=1 Tax=Agarivorans sp. OAG1 TaxID=3082387 RepID=UPI0030CBB9BC
MNAQMNPALTAELQPKSPPLFQKVLLVMAMMTAIGGSLTGVMTYLNLGYSPLFFSQWLSAFLLAASTIMPIGFLLMAAISKAAEKWLPKMQVQQRNIVVGVVMAVIMESGLAFSTTLNNLGLSNGADFLASWLQTLLTALPFALVLIITVSLTIKPRVERFLKS